RRTRRLARFRERKACGEGRRTSGRARGGAGKALAVWQACAKIRGRGADREGEEERQQVGRRGQGADRKSGVRMAPAPGAYFCAGHGWGNGVAIQAVVAIVAAACNLRIVPL